MTNGGDDRSGPAGPEPTDAYTRAYDDALSRLLDGLDAPTGTDGADGEQAAAQARAGVDVALISRALRLIGAEAAGAAGASADDDTVVGVGAGVAAGAEVDARVLPLRPVPPSADPVEIDESSRVASAPARRRVPPAGVLAAAASLVLVVGVGVVGVNHWGGSGGDNSAAVQQPAPAAAGLANAPASGQNSATGSDSFASGSGPAAGADTSAAAPAAGAAAAAGADAAAAPAAGAAAAPAPTSAKAAAKRSAAMPLAQAVACSRAVLVGEVVSVGDAKLAYRSKWTLRVTEWLRPTAGPAEVVYAVGGPRARLAGGGLGTLPPGQKGLFLVPTDKDAPLQAWTGLDEGSGRQKIDAALAKGWSGGC